MLYFSFQNFRLGRLEEFRMVLLYTAEIMALELVYEVRLDKAIICSDSIAVFMSLQSWQSNRKYILSEIMITLYSIKQIGVITWFIWVPAHVGIIGNEEVDIMAK